MSLKINQLNLNIAGKKVCLDLTITINPNEFWGVLGLNGVGKSTLLHHIINVDNIHNNSIKLDNKPLVDYKHQRRQLAHKTGILLQDYEYNFPCTVFEAALIGRHPYLSQWQWESESDLEIAKRALIATDMYQFKDRLTNTLSGGEKRRLNIATLLTQDPDYLLLDEPTNHLDLSAQIKMLDLLSNHIHKNNKSGIMVIHDANLANRYCDNVLMLFGNGEWASGPTLDMINVPNLERLYQCHIYQISDKNQTVYVAR